MLYALAMNPMPSTQTQSLLKSRLAAIRMAMLTKRIEALSEGDQELVPLYEEREMLLKKYYQETFGSNVVPMIARPS